MHKIHPDCLCSTASYKEKLIIFTRYPKARETKTRLIPVLGEKGAADLHRRMTMRIAEEARILQKIHPVSLEICYHGGTRSLMRQWLGPDYEYKPQVDGDLGDRMFSAFEEAFSSGMARVVLVGTDLPGLCCRIIESALHKLLSRDLVLGPATDGGYYLIGFNGRPNRTLFSGIPWGTPTVLEDTLRIAETHGLSMELLEPLKDVDRPEDLEFFLESADMSSCKERCTQ
jgi:rSAM/selenodomain-associated transferase 1